jgi:Protein of unknown function (DUF3593)
MRRDAVHVKLRCNRTCVQSLCLSRCHDGEMTLPFPLPSSCLPLPTARISLRIMRSSTATHRACNCRCRRMLRDTAARPSPLASHTKCTRQRHRVALPRATAELSALTDPWSVSSSETLASGLFAASLAPYLVFLWQLNRAKGPKLMNFGFAFLLVFVGATIPAGIYGVSSKPVRAISHTLTDAPAVQLKPRTARLLRM